MPMTPATGPTVIVPADGYQQLALKWAFENNGGLASEADYPYIGVTNFCNTSVPIVKFREVRMQSNCLSRGMVSSNSRYLHEGCTQHVTYCGRHRVGSPA